MSSCLLITEKNLLSCKEPVDLPCGHTYEKIYLEQTIREKKACPECGKKVLASDLVINQAVQNFVRQYNQEKKMKEKNKSPPLERNRVTRFDINKDKLENVNMIAEKKTLDDFYKALTRENDEGQFENMVEPMFLFELYDKIRKIMKIKIYSPEIIFASLKKRLEQMKDEKTRSKIDTIICLLDAKNDLKDKFSDKHKIIIRCLKEAKIKIKSEIVELEKESEKFSNEIKILKGELAINQILFTIATSSMIGISGGACAGVMAFGDLILVESTALLAVSSSGAGWGACVPSITIGRWLTQEVKGFFTNQPTWFDDIHNAQKAESKIKNGQ